MNLNVCRIVIPKLFDSFLQLVSLRLKSEFEAVFEVGIEKKKDWEQSSSVGEGGQRLCFYTQFEKGSADIVI